MSRMELRIVCCDLYAGKYRVCCYFSSRQFVFWCTKKTNPFSSEIHQKKYSLPISYQLFVTHLLFHVLDTHFTFLSFFLSLCATCKVRFLDLNIFLIFFFFTLHNKFLFNTQKKITKTFLRKKKKIK